MRRGKNVGRGLLRVKQPIVWAPAPRSPAQMVGPGSSHAERHMYHIIAGVRCRDSLPPNLTNLALGEESVCVILGIFFEQWIERESRGGRQYFGINLINANSCDAGRPHNQRRALQSQMKINAASPGPLLRRWLSAPAASSTGRMLRTHEDVWCVPFQPPPWMTSSAGHRTSSRCPSCLSNSASPKRIESPPRSMSWCDTPSISRPNRKRRRLQITLYPLLSRQSQSPGLARQPPLHTPATAPSWGLL